MKLEGKIYNSAFKTKVVQLGNERTNILELSRELGIKFNVTYLSRKECKEFGVRSVPGKGNLKLSPQ